MCDIVVVGDTAILSHLLVIHREHGMHLVSVAVIRAEERRTEMRGALIGIISTGIGVVEVESESQALVGIGGKHDVDMVLAIEFVSAVVVSDISNRRKGVGKQEFVGLLHHMRIRLDKHKLARQRLVNGNTR